MPSSADDTPARVPDDDDDDYDESDYHEPTLDDAVRLWHEAIEQKGDDTVYGMAEFAGFNCADTESQLPIWLESIRRVRVAGLFDLETATYLLHRLARMSFEEKGWLQDPEIDRLMDEMRDVCIAHGLDEYEDFWKHPNPPAEWTRLNLAADDRERELVAGVLRANGEEAMAREVRERPEEFAARLLPVEVRLKAEWEESRRRLRERADW